jgi:hypothetical protein
MPGSRHFVDRRRKPDGTLLATHKKEGGITTGELQRTAKHVLQFILNFKKL